jgi:GT2 family glycosyltransferase
MTSMNDDRTERLRDCAEESRSAKLRALGREQLLKAQLNSIVSSRSWKLTKHLRDATEWARTHFGRGVKREADRPFPIPTSENTSGSHKPGEITSENFSIQGREAWDLVGSTHLAALLEGRTRVVFPYAVECQISIIVVLYGKAHLGLLCIESILRNADVPYELILVDNNPTDGSGEMLEHLDGAVVIRNRENLGFGYACGQGAERARGEFLCFLNNDALLHSGSFGAVLADFREDKAIGVVGGKILLADGRLQEAGSMVWKDGSAWGYGRGDDPGLPRYNFRRPVDYCSGAFLFTPRSLFAELGGFDARFSPAYYEDSDYCFKVWDEGLKVIYEPRAVVHHYESASSEIAEAAKGPIAKNQAAFFDKWREQLQHHLARAGEHIPYARIAQRAGGARILYLSGPGFQSTDDLRFKGSDSVVALLAKEGHHLTVASTSQTGGELSGANSSRDIEYADVTTAAHYVFRELLSQYDAVWIDGQQSMCSFLLHICNMDKTVPTIIYEAGILSPRLAAIDSPITIRTDGLTVGISEALALCSAADLIFVTSEADRQFLLERGISNVHVLSATSITEVAAGIGTKVGQSSP